MYSTGQSRPSSCDSGLTKCGTCPAQRDEGSAQRDEGSAQRDESSAQRDESSAQRDESSAQRDESSAQRDFYRAGVLFLHSLTRQGASDHTKRNYAADLNLFIAFFCQRQLRWPDRLSIPRLNWREPVESKLSTFSLGQIKRVHLREFTADQFRQSSRSTVRRLSCLRAFFRFCQRRDLCRENVAGEVENPKVREVLPQPLDGADIDQLFSLIDTSEYLGLRDRAIVELLYSSGLRVGETAGLNREDVDFEQKWVRIRGKGKKERLIPITEGACRWVERYISDARRWRAVERHFAERDAQAVFLNRWGARLSARSIDRHFAKYLAMSGLAQRATPHTLRHSIATHWLERGMSLKMIQGMLGHRSLATTTGYARVSVKLQRETLRRADLMKEPTSKAAEQQ